MAGCWLAVPANGGSLPFVRTRPEEKTMSLLQHGTRTLGIDSNEEYERTGEHNKENHEPVRDSLLPCVPSAHHRGKAMTNPAPRKRRGPLIEVDAAITTLKPTTARALSR